MRANGEDHQTLNYKVVTGEVFSSLVICQGKVSYFFAEQPSGRVGFSSAFMLLSQSQLSQLRKIDIDLLGQDGDQSSRKSNFNAQNLPNAQQA